eukprot:IDg2010t1
MSASDEFAKYGAWALVTGASSGIGAQFVRSLAARGLHIILSARREDRLHALAAEVRAAHDVRTHVVRADLTVPGDIDRLIAEASRYDVGLLVNNAGVELVGAFLTKAAADVARVVAVNATAMALLAHGIGSRIASRAHGGGVIFVSSVLARPSPNMATYAATKAFTTTLAVSLRYELAASGVEVLSFEPGFVESEITDRMRANGVEVDALPVDTAVERCLAQFGKRAVYSPTFAMCVLKRIVDWLPYSWTMPLLV